MDRFHLFKKLPLLLLLVFAAVDLLAGWLAGTCTLLSFSLYSTTVEIKSVAGEGIITAVLQSFSTLLDNTQSLLLKFYTTHSFLIK
jgi:hypothetical protein